MRRKLTVSLPVAIVIGLVAVSGIAFAVFYLISITTVNLQAQGGATGTFSAPVCTIDGEGTITTCTKSGDNFNVAATGLDDASVVEVFFGYTPDSPQFISFVPPAVLPAGVSYIEAQQVSGGIAGIPLPDNRPISGADEYKVWVYLEDLEADMVVPTFQWEFRVSE